MKNFENIKFNGTFRDYQARIIDGLDKYFFDNKVHIVAAPGSGKTILGLEIIRKLGNSCLILSPTTTIRNQWGDRFMQMFLPADQNFEDYISFDLNNLKTITSITYQALYSAMNKIKSKTDEEEVDYSNIDLFKIIKENNINTICLDEAHHLQNEWQKALEKFIKNLDKNIKIISLTATPPYDSSPAEWQRYIDICGEIDEEIFIPELVGKKNLCPHQDYIYFNFPTKEEINQFSNYKQSILDCFDSLKSSQIMPLVAQKIEELYTFNDELLYANVKEIIATIILLSYFNINVNPKIVKALTTKKILPKFNFGFAETSLNFLINFESFLNENLREELKKILKSFGVIDKNKVELSLNASLKRKLISSMGKLESIGKIAKCESNSLKENLRMLVLTDYIKKENTKLIGKIAKFSNISVVSIFETLRTALPNEDIAVLSGTLIILPEKVLKELQNNKVKNISVQKIENTKYVQVNLKMSNRDKVATIGKLFEEGKIKILVGTKSLLGEGWDSPSINTLILASFVGSFMLSNQMRGRAIRIDKNNPNKTANIWHLVTVEPENIINNKFSLIEDKSQYNQLHSIDYEILERRFESFIGPDYETGEIVSGIDRIKIIKPPFNKKGIEDINQQMTQLSSDRNRLEQAWENSEAKSGKTVITTEVPKDVRVPNAKINILGISLMISTLLSTIFVIITYQNFKSSLETKNLLFFIISIAILVLSLIISPKIYYKIISHISPINSIKSLCKCILKTMQSIDIIDCNSHIKVKNYDNIMFDVWLLNASVYEQNVFNYAVKEMFSVIENPRYLLIKRNKLGNYNYKYAYACPSIIGQNKEYVKTLAHYLEKSMGKMALVYTRNEEGRKLILKCRKKSYITFNEQCLNNKYKVVNFE